GAASHPRPGGAVSTGSCPGPRRRLLRKRPGTRRSERLPSHTLVCAEPSSGPPGDARKLSRSPTQERRAVRPAGFLPDVSDAATLSRKPRIDRAVELEPATQRTTEIKAGEHEVHLPPPGEGPDAAQLQCRAAVRCNVGFGARLLPDHQPSGGSGRG